MSKRKTLESKFLGRFLLMIPFLVIFLIPSITLADPVILYTDILSGPNTGGENNNGAYLSIFGKGFGTTRGTSTVTINGVEVAAYKQWGAPSKVYDSHGIQVITVQPGPNVLSGSIVVTVNGEKSNSNQTFTVQSGKIFFTDYANGNDMNDGSINSPKKSVQNLWNDRSVYNPGDIIVMRGQTYTVAQAGDTFVKFRSNSMGTPENPTIIMGYPGEDVFIDMSVSGGAEIFSTSTGSPPTGAGLILSNFRAHTGGPSAIRFTDVDYGRLVNTEIEGMNLLGNGTGMISSHSDFTHILGNKAHNSGQNKYYHSIYWSDQGHDDEIGWNHIYDIRGGRAIQVYDGGTTPFYNFAVHDNVIHDVDRDGINFGGPSTTGIRIYNNIIYRTGLGTSNECCGKGGNAGRSGIQMTAGLLDGSEIFNNTLFDNQGDEGQIRLAGKNMKVYNNIFYVDTCFRNTDAGQTGCTDNNGQYFYSLESYLDTSTLTAKNNVWYSVVQPPRQAVPSWDTNPITSNPNFVDSTNPARNFHLQAGSPAIDAGTAVSVSRDFDGTLRPQNGLFDIGAYEYCASNCSVSDTQPPTVRKGLK